MHSWAHTRYDTACQKSTAMKMVWWFSHSMILENYNFTTSILRYLRKPCLFCKMQYFRITILFPSKKFLFVGDLLN